MTNVKDDEDFWYSSEKRSFSFENNEVDQLFGVSKTNTDRLWMGISDGVVTSESYDKPTDDFSNLKPMLSIISDKTLSRILQADQIQPISSESDLVGPDLILKKMLLHEPCSLEQCKSVTSKIDLLDAAIKTGDGNAILTIILFITKTLNSSLVQKILLDRLDAVHIYVHYLSIRLRITEMTDILTMLGLSTDAALQNLNVILKNTRNPDRLIQKLKNCVETHFSTLFECKESIFVQRYIKLLEWQIGVKQNEAIEHLELNTSVSECLRYMCDNHWNTPEGDLDSSTLLVQQHDVAPRQYKKIALMVASSKGAWKDLDRILLTKGWLGSQKLQTCLLIEDILQILHQHHAPMEVLEKFLKHVDNMEKKLELAKKLSCHKVVVDILAQQGDRLGLMKYKPRLTPQSEEYFHAESALHLPTIKWKN